MNDIIGLLETAKKAAIKAGAAILNVYHSDNFDVTMKGDQSPLTRADKAAHAIIAGDLKETGLPVLSEEGSHIPYEERKAWDWFWLVDPLDGTKEFIHRTKEFTVNIALIERNKPVLGVVFAPALQTLYWNDPSGTAWKIEIGALP